MKTLKVTLLAALVSSSLSAETIDKTWDVGVFGDYIKSSTDKEFQEVWQPDWQQIEAGKGLGLDFQKFVNENWDVRFELAKTRYQINDGHGHDYGTRFGVDGVYKIDDSDFYLFGGVRRFNNVQSYNAVDVGAGYKAQLNERVSFYTEAAVYRDLDFGMTDQGFKLGFKYAFGEAKSVPVTSKPAQSQSKPAPVVDKVSVVDSDNDGVNDTNDRCPNTAVNVKVDSQGCTLYLEKEVAINLNLEFENNSAVLKPSMVDDIRRLADFMSTYKNTNVVIEGHSSAIGNAKYNLAISQKRADAVRNVLINKFNIEPSRLIAIGFGETQLLSEGTTAADHNLNRRVVAKVHTTIKSAITKN